MFDRTALLLTCKSAREVLPSRTSWLPKSFEQGCTCPSQRLLLPLLSTFPSLPSVSGVLLQNRSAHWFDRNQPGGGKTAPCKFGPLHAVNHNPPKRDNTGYATIIQAKKSSPWEPPDLHTPPHHIISTRSHPTATGQSHKLHCTAHGCRQSRPSHLLGRLLGFL